MTDTDPPCWPEQMPDLRTHLHHSWDTESWRHQALAAVGASFQHEPTNLRSQSVEELTARQIYWDRETLDRSDLWWVGPEMCDLLYATVPKVPGDTLVANLTFPSTYGFVVFAKPWESPDSRSAVGVVHVDAVVWGPIRLAPEDVAPDEPRDAISLSFYRYAGKGNNPFYAALRGALSADGLTPLLPQTKVWVPLGRSDWPLDRSVDQPIRWHGLRPDVEASYLKSAADDRRLFAALATLLSTASLARIDEQHPTRAARRRAERAGVAAAKPVRVVTLRRPESPKGDHDAEHHSVEWSHRWIVGAHMRNQPCGPGRSQRRLTLIAPYQKGPADKPLVVKPTVRAWVR